MPAKKHNKGKFYCTTWLFSFLQFSTFEKGYAFQEKTWLFTVEQQGFVKIRHRWRICNVCKKKSFMSKVCKVHFFATCEVWYSVFLFKMRHSLNIAKGTTDTKHFNFDSFKSFNSKQKLQKALKSWSNFSLALLGKGREIFRTTLTNPCNHLNKSI